MLDVRDLHVTHGRIAAVRGVDLHIGDREIVALVGANGAGKSSILGALAGVLSARGEVTFDGKPMHRMAPHRRVAAGFALVPEGRGILATMSVHENLLMGGYLRRRADDFDADVERVYERFPQLRDRRSVPAGLLSGGEQQMLAIGRALVGRPRLLALDEPSLGLAPKLIRQMMSLVAELRDEGITVFLVEQNVRQALRIADRAYVLETGEIRLEGPARDLLQDPQVKEAFLGGRTDGRSREETPPS